MIFLVRKNHTRIITQLFSLSSPLFPLSLSLSSSSLSPLSLSLSLRCRPPPVSQPFSHNENRFLYILYFINKVIYQKYMMQKLYITYFWGVIPPPPLNGLRDKLGIFTSCLLISTTVCLKNR